MSNKNKLYNLIKKILITLDILEIARDIKTLLRYRISYFKYKIAALLFKNNFDKQAANLLKVIGSRIIYINPEIITTSIKGPDAPKPRTNFIFNGDWDIDEKIQMGESENAMIKKSASFITIQQLFVDGIPYQDCREYKIFRQWLLEKNIPYRNCTNLKLLDNHFQNLIKIFEDIRKNGYKTQKQLRRKHSVLRSVEGDEIFIFIGRNGNLVGGNGGRHRMAIVKLLRIDKVPVLIVGVHRIWAKKCFEKYKTDVLSAINKGLGELDWVKGFYQ